MKAVWHTKFFYLLLFFLPTQLGLHFWPDSAYILGIRSDYLSPTVYLTDVLIVTLLTVYFYETGIYKKILATQKWLVVLVLYLFITSLFVAVNQVAAIYKTIKVIEMFLLAYYVYKNKASLTNSRTFYYVFSVSLLYSSLIGVLQFALQHSIGGILWILGERSFLPSTPGIANETILNSTYLRSYSIFSHPNSFAGYLAVGLWILSSQKGFYYLFVKIICLFAIVLSFSHVIWLAIVISTVFFLITNNVKSVYLLAFFIFGIVANVCLFYIDTSNLGVQRRNALFDASLEIIFANPLLGVGLNNYLVHLPGYLSTNGITWFIQPVHNIFLLVLSEIGLVGLVLIILMFRKYYLERNDLVVALLIIVISSSFDHYWFTLQQNQLLLSILLGLGLSPTFSENFKLS